MVKDTTWLGHVKVILKGDNEESLAQVVREALRAIRVRCDVERAGEEHSVPVWDLGVWATLISYSYILWVARRGSRVWVIDTCVRVRMHVGHASVGARALPRA